MVTSVSSTTMAAAATAAAAAGAASDHLVRTYVRTYLPTYLPTYLHTYLPTFFGNFVTCNHVSTFSSLVLTAKTTAAVTVKASCSAADLLILAIQIFVWRPLRACNRSCVHA